MSKKFRQPLFKGTQLFPDIFKLSPSMRVSGPGTRTSEGRERFIETQDKINKFVSAMNQNYYLSDLKTYDVKKYMGNGIYVRYSNQFDQEYVNVWVEAEGEVREKEHDPFVFIGVRLLNADACPGTLNLFVWEKGTDEVLSPSRTELGNSSPDFSAVVPLTFKSVTIGDKVYSYTSGGMWATTAVATPDQIIGNQRENVVWDQAAVLDYEDKAAVREMSGDVIPVAGYVGVYQIKVNLTADDCEDYPPAECELYVVAGRNASQFQEVYSFTIQRGTDYLYLTYPFGANAQLPPYWVEHAAEPPPPDNGPNPHGFNWWQDGVEVFSVPRANTEFDQSQPKNQWTESFISAISFKSNLVPDTGFAEYSAPDEGSRCPVSNPEWIQIHESSIEKRYGYAVYAGVAPWGPTDTFSVSYPPTSSRLVVFQKTSFSVNNTLTYSSYSGETYYEDGDLTRLLARSVYLGEVTSLPLSGEAGAIVADTGNVFPISRGNDAAGFGTTSTINLTYGEGLSLTGYYAYDFGAVIVTAYDDEWISYNATDSEGLGEVNYKGVYTPSMPNYGTYWNQTIPQYCEQTGKGAKVFAHITSYTGSVLQYTYQFKAPTDKNYQSYYDDYVAFFGTSPPVKYIE